MLDISDNLVPVYARIEQDIRGQIESGALRMGDQIPTEQELSARYGVARMTVRQGLSRLVAEGLLQRRRGIGTFVAIPKLEREGHRLLGFEEDARAHGITPATVVLAQRWTSLAKEDARMLGISRNEKGVPIRQREQDLRRSHLARLRAALAESLETSEIHLDVLTNLKRINSHITAIVFPIIEDT